MASPAAISSACGFLTHEWGEDGYGVEGVECGYFSARIHVVHSDGSRFTITADRYGNIMAVDDEPYMWSSRKHTWVPAAPIFSDARAWVADCVWGDDPEELSALTDDQIRKGIERHYVGGWDQFMRDAS